jgi:hypothetical protein
MPSESGSRALKIEQREEHYPFREEEDYTSDSDYSSLTATQLP